MENVLNLKKQTLFKPTPSQELSFGIEKPFIIGLWVFGTVKNETNLKMNQHPNTPRAIDVRNYQQSLAVTSTKQKPANLNQNFN